MAVGETPQLTVTLRDAAGSTLTGRSVTWSSGATSVVPSMRMVSSPLSPRARWQSPPRARGKPDRTAIAEIFDPSSDQFTRVGDLTTTRMLHFAVLLESDGTVLVGGGQDATGDVLASAEVFDPASGAFRAVGDMPVAGSEQGAAWVP